jgi:hypothetical protein
MYLKRAYNRACTLRLPHPVQILTNVYLNRQADFAAEEGTP